MHYFRVKPLKRAEYLFRSSRERAGDLHTPGPRDIVIHTSVVPEGYNLWDVGRGL